MKAVQPEGERGSLKWMQRSVHERWQSLEAPIFAATGAESIEWRSPLASDGYAEYRDADFLQAIRAERLSFELSAFWPRRGPQWDALANTDRNQVLLVEAKAHVPEFCTPGTSATLDSRAAIAATLTKVAAVLGASKGELWPDIFYQYANRLAHLWFLRNGNIDAYLVLVGFVGDTEMKGPKLAEAWEAAYTVADYALGLPKRHALSPYIIHVHPQVPQ